MEFWKEVRRQVLTNELSQRAAMKKYGLGWHTLEKILAHAEPLGYRQSKARPKRKLEPFLPIIHQILADDRQAPKKQRHTAQRIFERLRDEHGFQGGKTAVKDAVRAGKPPHQEVFLPVSHPPGEAQVDFGEATVKWNGVERLVGFARRNFLVPAPQIDSLETPNQQLREGCRGDPFFEPIHYLALPEHKPGGNDYARPLENWPLPSC